MRAYARDLNLKYVWGPALPIIRLVVRSGLTFPYPPDPLLVEPLPRAPLKPDPVYSRWKVWRGLELRDPLPLVFRIRRIEPRRWDAPTEVATEPVEGTTDDEGPTIY